MELGGHADPGLAGTAGMVKVVPALSLIVHPLGVMVFGVIGIGMGAPKEEAVPVVDSFLDPAVAGGEMKLAHQAAVVALVGEYAGDEDFVVRDTLAVLTAASGAGIASGQE